MPARETSPPGAIPGHFAARFCRFPQREIFWIMPVSIYAFAHARQHVLKLIARELTIAGEAFNVVVQVTIDFISYTLRQQAFNDSYHLRNVPRRARKDVGR